MPSGMLVTRQNPEYNYDGWQLKVFGESNNIRETLRSQWTPTVINLMLFDKETPVESIITFHEHNLYELHGRSSYLIYCIIVPINYHDSLYPILTKKQKFISDQYETYQTYEDYNIYINDFVKDILQF